MKCPNCDGRGKTTEYDGLRKFWCDYKCEYCNGTGEVDMTNEQWLKQCTTEQLAKWLSKISKFFHECGKRDVYPKTMCEEDWEWWLKQPHHEKE